MAPGSEPSPVAAPADQPPTDPQLLHYAHDLATLFKANPHLDPPVHQRVLVADDDPLVRTLVATTLTTRGYEVLEAADSRIPMATVPPRAGGWGRPRWHRDPGLSKELLPPDGG